MLDLRERLASHLYRSGLDTDPESVPALKFGAVPFDWSIGGNALSIFPPFSASRSYPLTGTVSQLAATMTADGYPAEAVNVEVGALASGALLNPGTVERQPSTQPVHIFQANLWTLLDAYGVEVHEADLNVEQAIQQLYLQTASDDILDFWGEFFSVIRKPGETDETLRQRMIDEVFRLRSNPLAIQQAIKDETGFDVAIREPWRELFLLNQSALSDTDHFQDGSFFTWNVLQPVYYANLSVAERAMVIEIINRNRPAGCVLLGEASTPPISFAVGSLSFSALSDRRFVYDLAMPTTPLLWPPSGVPTGEVPIFVRQTGDVRITLSVPALSLFGWPTWGAVNWGSLPWVKGFVSAVVTQQSV